MSYILDALKTADAKRGRDSLPGLHAPAARIVFAAARREQRPWAWILGGVAVVLAAWGLWWLAWHQGGPATYANTALPPVLQPSGAAAAPVAAPAPVAVPPLPAVQPQPAPSQPAQAAEPATGGAPNPQAVVARAVKPSPVAAAPVGASAAVAVAAGRSAPLPAAPSVAAAGGPEAAAVAQPRRAAVSEPGQAPVSAQRTPARPQVALPAGTRPQPETAHARPDSPAPNGANAAAPTRIPVPAAGAAAAAPRLYTLDELAPDLRRELPAIAVNGASYSENPAHRMLIVNGQVLHEGEAAAPELLLEEIRLKMAVFRFRGTRFALPY